MGRIFRSSSPHEIVVKSFLKRKNLKGKTFPCPNDLIIAKDQCKSALHTGRVNRNSENSQIWSNSTKFPFVFDPKRVWPRKHKFSFQNFT